MTKMSFIKYGFWVCLMFTLTTNAQNLSGQWKGSFNEVNNYESTEYVLELDIKGKTVEGVSITYFTIRGKKYYTMCAVNGSYDPAAKTVVSKEVSKIKANTPDWFRDCFQTHTLTYFKKGDEEQLSGTWKSAKREDNCGRGTTLLSRKTFVKKQSSNQSQPVVEKEKSITPAKSAEEKKEQITNHETINKDHSISKADTIATQHKERIAPPKTNKLEKRSDKVFERLELEQEEIYVSIYDNAEIDGDVITVLFNGEVILSNQTLGKEPISLRLKLNKGIENTITMYAENQGKIPPNTAIMRIQNGENFYKVLLSADDKQNASLILKLKE
jgi:hypothetical protein